MYCYNRFMNKTLTELSFFGYDILEELLEDDAFKTYILSYQNLSKQQDKIDAFIDAKHTYETALNNNHPHSLEIKAIRKMLSKAKQDLYETEEAKAFIEAERVVQDILSEIIDVVGQTISPNIQTPNHKHIGGSCGIHE